MKLDATFYGTSLVFIIVESSYPWSCKFCSHLMSSSSSCLIKLHVSLEFVAVAQNSKSGGKDTKGKIFSISSESWQYYVEN